MDQAHGAGRQGRGAVITNASIAPITGLYDFEARADALRRKRLALRAEGKVINAKLELPGITLIVTPELGLVILYDSTIHVKTDSGPGMRENTASLRGRIEMMPRPASGTQAFPRSAAPTKYDIQGETR